MRKRFKTPFKHHIDFAEMVVKHHKFINKLFIGLFLLNLLFYFFVDVNYDLSEYLPESAPSKIGLNVMEDEFGYPGSARLMLEDVSLYEAKLYKDKISEIEGVDMVLWADLFLDVYQSSSFIDYDEIEDYYKDGYACMDVIFIDGDSDKPTHKALDEIKNICGDKIYMGGPAVQNKSLGETLNREMMIAMTLGVLMIALVLCLTTTSWFEPVMFLTVMLIAIILNMGSNIIVGQISFLTYSIAAVLQLAIAMDYSIFLLHTFTHEKEKGLDTETALKNAIRQSSSSILASGVTTIVGFVVMTIMSFKIGADIGIVLAKGVVLSLLTVIFFMPSLILKWYPIIEKTRHKSFMPSFRRMASSIYRIRIFPLVFVALIVVPCYIGQNMNDFTYGSESVSGSPGTEVYAAEQAMNEKFGKSNLLMLVVPNQGTVTERNLYNDLNDLEYVKAAISIGGILPDGIPLSILPGSVKDLMYTDNYTRIMVTLRTSSESELAFQAVDHINELMHGYYPEDAYLIGVTPSTEDIKNVIVDDYERVNWLSLLGVALVIMCTFKSPVLPVIVMIPIEVAIFLSMAMSYVAGSKVMYVGYIVVSCLQLGATIDYSILMTDKYIEARKTHGKKESVIEAVSGSALSIFTSGSILAIVGYGLFFVSSVEAIGGMGRMVGRGALCSLFLVMTILPALLYYTDILFVKSPENPGLKVLCINFAKRILAFAVRAGRKIAQLPGRIQKRLKQFQGKGNRR